MHNVLIVGASRGIGLGLADAFLQRGAQVFACSAARNLARICAINDAP
ncbi:SDR family NAD(P)-dependent oxidoreductase [Pseudomonas aeruginosa]